VKFAEGPPLIRTRSIVLNFLLVGTLNYCINIDSEGLSNSINSNLAVRKLKTLSSGLLVVTLEDKHGTVVPSSSSATSTLKIP